MDKVVINGGNVYFDSIELKDNDNMNNALHRLHFQMFQHLQSQCGFYEDMELALHIKISRERRQYARNDVLYGRIETLPVIEQEYRVLMPIEPEPYLVHRKCTLKERLKILFKGAL